MESDVVCLDTHMLQLYNSNGNVYRKPLLYESIENTVVEEATTLQLPPFVYQWASWDWKRITFNGQKADDHSFLWRSGQTKFQISLGLDKPN